MTRETCVRYLMTFSLQFSQRWNTLLSFECRNRLLLTGTPIQNTMQEVYMMPITVANDNDTHIT